MDSNDYSLIRPVQGLKPSADIGNRQRRGKKEQRQQEAPEEPAVRDVPSDITELVSEQELPPASEEPKTIDYRA